jgi:hypothetical protein
MFEVKSHSLVDRAIDALPDERSVLRVGALENQFH